MSIVGGAGIDFWTLTPRQIQNVFDGHADRLQREHNDRAWAVWHGAYLGAYPPEKPRNFTSLSKLLITDTPKTKPAPDWERTFDEFSAWVGGSKKG